MRLGVPLIPVLKQQHQAPVNKLRTPRRLAAGDSVSSARGSDIGKEESGNDGVYAHQANVAATSSRSMRRSEGAAGRRAVRSINNSAGSTGGTGSSGNINGTAASPLSALWSQLDDLDQDLHARAQAVQARSSASRRTNVRKEPPPMLRTPDSTPSGSLCLQSQDVIFERTPEMEPKDVVFPETPDHTFKDKLIPSLPEDITMGEGSVILEESDMRPVTARRTPYASPQRSPTASAQGASPQDLQQTSPDGSGSSGLQRDRFSSKPSNSQASATSKPRGAAATARPRTPTERRLAGAGFSAGVLGRKEGQVSSRDTVAKLTTRIRQLEGELETAVGALSTRQQAPKHGVRRSGSAPPTRRRPIPPSAASPSVQMPPESPQVAPRIMCRETLGETQGASSVDTGTLLLNAVESQLGLFRTEADADVALQPSRLWHICQMMQMERRGLLETLQDVCKKCNIEAEVDAPSFGTNSQTCEALTDSANDARSPRKLLSKLCEAHLALRERASVDDKASPRDDCSLQYSETPASPREGLLLDSPWAAPVARFVASRAGGNSNTGGAGSQCSDIAKASTDQAFAAAADQLRSVLARVSTNGDVGAYASLTREARQEMWQLLDAARQADSVFTPMRPKPRALAPQTEEAFKVEDQVEDTFKVEEVEESAGVDAIGQALAQGGSPRSSISSLPAVGRLCELVDEKRREVADLQVRCGSAATNEEQSGASTLLTAAREELRLLREFLGEGGDESVTYAM